ncbi:uncharacterized protein EV422DRAFT_300795 [Fimicolochytrium jonesii]|uniref:uncharacterized protein n=1 Tax=Fimicolochytrium jonesii TaxID=1396493 RepID=UPI0022FDEAE5|nr:uncharacterized protein EV422DRAFT_300795 [Fimicolochytrium jonesii]KAI8823955.1 hypothetical protein EV422DRAFT_300795 [Fimicolochytrium jonesii]
MVDKGRRASLRGVLSQSSLLLFLDKRQPREVVADVLGFVFHEICDEGFTDMIMDPSLKLNKRRSIPERMFGLLVNQPEEREVDEAVRTLDVRIINCLCALAGVWPKTIPGLCMPSITNRLVTYLQSARVGMDADETREPPHGWQTYRSTLRLLSTLLSHHSTHPIDPKISEPAIHTLIAVLARSVYAVRNLGGDEACAEVGDVAREMMGAVVVRPEEAYEEVFGGEFGEV